MAGQAGEILTSIMKLVGGIASLRTKIEHLIVMAMIVLKKPMPKVREGGGRERRSGWPQAV